VAPETVCLTNLGPRERQKRLLTGIGGLAGGAALAAWFLIAGVSPRPLYLLVFIPLLVGALGIYQALAGT
jgi:hypothetical protein